MQSQQRAIKRASHSACRTGTRWKMFGSDFLASQQTIAKLMNAEVFWQEAQNEGVLCPPMHSVLMVPPD